MSKIVETKLTAMQILFNRNQEIINKLEFSSNPLQVEYRKALISVNDDIDTELLEIERNQLVWAIQEAYGHGRDEADDVLFKQVEYSIQVILRKLNTK